VACVALKINRNQVIGVFKAVLGEFRLKMSRGTDKNAMKVNLEISN
jgi:hypothetical protein